MGAKHVKSKLKTLLIVVVVASSAQAEERYREYSPEINAFHNFSNGTRLFLLADTTKQESKDAWQNEWGVHLDISSKEARRQYLHVADWSRARTVGLRIGYRQLREWDDERQDVDERRGLLEFTFRGVLPFEIGMANRFGFDYRDLSGTSSQRYRYRLQFDREFSVWNTVFVPYVNGEAVYDSRYSGWSRKRYQLGSEIGLGDHWRVEPYIALNKQTRPTSVTTEQIGLVAKLYW